MDIQKPYGSVPNLAMDHLFRKSWEAFRKNPVLIVGVLVVYSLITNGLPALLGQESVLGRIVQLIIFIINGPLLAGAYFVALRLVRGDSVEFAQMFEGFQVFGKAFGVFFLYGAAVVIGLMLLIVPGVIAAVGLMPAVFLVLDGDAGVIDTLKRAWAMTTGYRIKIFLVFLAVLGLNLLGVLALVIGVFLTGAFSMLLIASVYEELNQAGAGTHA